MNWRTDALAYANTCHAAEVEVDVETGAVHILNYVALQDSGVLINPMLVEGQMQGGIAHGIGNALYEWMGYDDAAQPVTTTFADYLLPTATEIPSMTTIFKETPSPLNPLGAKGAGEVDHPDRRRDHQCDRGCAAAVQRAHRPGAAAAAEDRGDDPERRKIAAAPKHCGSVDHRVFIEVERDWIVRRRVLGPKLPEIEAELVLGYRSEQVSIGRQGAVVGDLVAAVGRLARRSRNILRRHSAGAGHDIHDLLAADPAGVALVVVRMRR